MKDIETIIPFLREYLNERGLKDVRIDLRLQDVPNDIINNTYTTISAKSNSMILANQIVKKQQHGKDSITLESKYF
jgi:hypothetical protein